MTRRAFKESTRTTSASSPAAWPSSRFLALFPALIAGLTLYGLVADPATVARQIEGLAGRCPETPSR